MNIKWNVFTDMEIGDRTFKVTKLCLIVLLSLNAFGAEAVLSDDKETSRSYNFHAKHSILPLLDQLDGIDTEVYTSWPRQLYRQIPRLINAAVVHNDSFNGTLMGQPVHVQAGDRLHLTLTNEISHSGLSIHVHGFGFNGNFLYSGAIGISQCPLTAGESLTYDFVVNETPGTYWYHIQSGYVGSDADAIRGPLVVHPKGTEEESIVNELNSFPHDKKSPLAYRNERILFLMDGFLSPNDVRLAYEQGDLYGPVMKNDEGFVVSSIPWEFGTCNGKLREVIHVSRNKKYIFRLINGGTHHALRFSIDNFPLTVVAADSEPVEPYSVDEVILHVGERFDVELSIYDDVFERESFWIRADALGPYSQGYSRGIRAVLTILDNEESPADDSDIVDPPGNIQTSRDDEDLKVLNCGRRSNCIPITHLRPLNKASDGVNFTESKIHTVDTHFTPAPQYAHFVRLDGTNFTQNELPLVAMSSRTFRADMLHPNTVTLNLSRTSPNIIVWRTTLLTDHPIHIHGHKVEILDVAYASIQTDCTLKACKLSRAYESTSRVKALDTINSNATIRKDTFVIPAGGAVVTRLYADVRGLWLATGQVDVHGLTGMSFVVNIGDFRVPIRDDWPLPVDTFPSCESAFVESQQKNPDCDCYIDKNAPLRVGTDGEKSFCSRPHLCRHKENLDSYKYDRGIHIQSDFSVIPAPFVTASFAFFMLLIVVIVMLWRPNNRETKLPSNQKRSSIMSTISNSLGDLSGRCSSSFIRFVPPSRTEGHSGNESALCIRSTPRVASSEAPKIPTTARRFSYNSVGFRWSGISSRSSFKQAFDKVFSERNQQEENSDDVISTTLEIFDRALSGYDVQSKIDIVLRDEEKANKNSSCHRQLLYLIREQWHGYLPRDLKIFRFVEVVGIAFITGSIFDTAEDSTNSVSGINDLVLLSTIYFTFSRMFPSVVSHHEWFSGVRIIFRYRRFSLAPVFASRILAVLLQECIWPIVFCFVCFPLADLVGDINRLLQFSIIITMNNICYIFLGAVIGSFASKLQFGMTAAMMISQGTILAAGVFYELPPSFQWARKISPFFWTVQGLLKSMYRWSDTVDCVKGFSSDAPSNQCFIEFDPIIERYKRRGIHVATFNDPSSEHIVAEITYLILAAVVLSFILFLRCFFTLYKVNWENPNIRGRLSPTTDE